MSWSETPKPKETDEPLPVSRPDQPVLQEPELPDSFDLAAAGFVLDDTSRQRAVDCGEALAREFPPEKWRDGDLMARFSALRSAESALSKELSVPVAPATLDFNLEEGDYGWSAGEQVAVAAWTMERDSPADMLETLAHEYRHQWQRQVIEGNIPHPAGEAARAELARGQETYQTYDFDAYIENALEVDAEAFGVAVSAAYFAATHGGTRHGR